MLFQTLNQPPALYPPVQMIYLIRSITNNKKEKVEKSFADFTNNPTIYHAIKTNYILVLLYSTTIHPSIHITYISFSSYIVINGNLIE
jgi:hypothetical protein